jgi:hypothetical protein
MGLGSIVGIKVVGGAVMGAADGGTVGGTVVATVGATVLMDVEGVTVVEISCTGL